MAIAPHLRVESSEFSAALKRLEELVPRQAAHIANQAAIDVAGYAFDRLPPKTGGGVDAKRREVAAYMKQPISKVGNMPVKLRQSKKGRIRRANLQLRRVNLLAQKMAKRYGWGGLYGGETKGKKRNRNMFAVSKWIMNRSVSGVGYLKAMFVPMIRTLNPIVKYKFPFARTMNISTFGAKKRRKNKSTVEMAYSTKPYTFLRWDLDLASKGESQNVLNRLISALSDALRWKTQRFRNEIERVLQPEFDKFKGGLRLRRGATNFENAKFEARKQLPQARLAPPKLKILGR